MMRRLIIFLAVLVACPVTAAAEPLTLTLDQAIERAMKVNYDVVEAGERLEQLKATVGEARAGALPQITGSAVYTRNVERPQLFFNGAAVTIGSKNNYSASVSATQALYEAGKVFKAIAAAKSERRKSEADVKFVKSEIEYLVKRTFYQILMADKTVEITKKTLGQLEAHLAAIQSRYNEGLESDYTLMRQEVEVSNLRPELSGAEQVRLVLMNTLKLLLVLPEDAEVVIDGRLRFAPVEIAPEKEMITQALAKRQDLVATSARVESYKQKVGVERGGYLPTLSLNTALSWQAQTNDFKIGPNENYRALNAGATLSWPLFDGFKTHYRISGAKHELKIAGEEDARKRANIINEVKNVRAAHEESRQRESSQKKTLDLADKAVRIAGERFATGLMSQVELNDTILARDTAERLYLRAVYDCLVTKAELEKTIGGKL